MDPLKGKQSNPPHEPSAVPKFGGRAVSVLKTGVKCTGKIVKAPLSLLMPLFSFDTSVQQSRNSVLGIFKYRNASTDKDKQKRSLAVMDAMGEVAKDFAKIKGSGEKKEALFKRMIKSSMGLSSESGCDSNARIANIHYWVIACERGINPEHLSDEEKNGLQIMQDCIREAADEFHQKNLAILGDAMTEANEGDAPTTEEIAEKLLNCLSSGERHHHRAAKVGYDFGALKHADRTQEINDSGFLDSSILRNHYMAPKPGGLGIEDSGDAMDQHRSDWNNYEGPYSPDFWDGSDGRTLRDLMRHVDVEMLKESIDDFDGDSREIYDLRFPIVTPKEPRRVSPFDPGPSIHDEDDDDFDTHYDPVHYIYDESDDEDDDLLKEESEEHIEINRRRKNPLKIEYHRVNEYISVEDDKKESINKKEVISPRSLAWEEEVEEEDRIISELVDAPEIEKEVIQLNERELDVLEDDFVAENQGSIAEQYNLPYDAQFIELSEPVRGQGELISADKLDPLMPSGTVNIETDNQRRVAPKQSQADFVNPSELKKADLDEGELNIPNLTDSASGRIEIAKDNKVSIRFFDPGIIDLLDKNGIGTKDLELLEKHEEIQPLKDRFSSNPDMQDADKVKLVQARLAEVKGNLSPEDYLAHYHGMAPKGDALKANMLATQSLFNNLFGGEAGKTVAGVLQDMALQQRQEKLDEDKQVFLEELLEKKGKTLEDFKNFAPENIFDAYMVDGFFNEEDLPALLAFTADKEVVTLDGGADPSSYDGLLENEEAADRIVLLKNADGSFQVLGPISDEDEVAY